MLKTKYLASLLLALSVGTAWADDATGVEIYGTAGVPGFGMGVGYGINEQFGVRGDFTTMGRITRKFDEDAIRYSGKLSSNKFNLYGDFYPFTNSFRLTAGLSFGRTKVEATGQGIGNTTQSFTIGGKTYQVTTDNNDKVNASVRYPAVSPYIGIGWGHNAKKREAGTFGFNADLGIYIGKPKVSVDLSSSLNDKLTAQEGGADAAAKVNERVNAERDKIKDRIGKYRVIPAINVGVSYYF